MLYLVHHGAAVEADIDPQRPLSAEGRAAVLALAREAAARQVRPAVIWHSGKLRARQTAEVLWRECNALAALIAQRGLQPADPPEWMADAIAAAAVDAPDTAHANDIMIVGHMPHLPRLRAHLLREPVPDFPLHGMVALERERDTWKERWILSQAR